MSARSDTLKAWRSGLKLGEALKLFPRQLDRAELAKAAKKQRRGSAIGKQKFREAGVNADQLLNALDEWLLRLSATVQAGQFQKEQIIRELADGDLIAVGFPSDRPKAAKPEPVPQFLLQLEFANFAKSEFSDGDRRYTHVRIVPAGALKKPKIGRPSIRDSVVEIASALANAGDITKRMPAKVQAGRVREYGKQHFPADFTELIPSEQTIKRHLKKFWNSN